MVQCHSNFGLDPWDLSGSTAEIDGYAGLVDNGAENHYLVSPALDLSAETAITISFDYEGAYDDSDSDSFELVYSQTIVVAGTQKRLLLGQKFHSTSVRIFKRQTQSHWLTQG